MKRHMTTLVSVPVVVSVVLAIILCLFAWSGIKVSIVDAMVIMGAGFFLSHTLLFTYNLGKVHAERKLSKVTPPAVLTSLSINLENRKKENTTKTTPTKNLQRDPAQDFC